MPFGIIAGGLSILGNFLLLLGLKLLLIGILIYVLPLLLSVFMEYILVIFREQITGNMAAGIVLNVTGYAAHMCGLVQLPKCFSVIMSCHLARFTIDLFWRR